MPKKSKSLARLHVADGLSPIRTHIFVHLFEQC